MRWHVIGPTLEVLDSDGASFVVRRDGTPIANAFFEPGHDAVQITLDTTLDRASSTEAYRLLARLACGLFQWPIELHFNVTGVHREALRRDGFTQLARNRWRLDRDRWRRDVPPFVLRAAEKFEQVDEVYQEPLFAPWQFTPIDIDMTERVAREIVARPAAHVLDLGCGYGKNTPTLETLTPALFSLDISLPAVKRCRSITARPAHVVAASATNLPWRDATFDIVVDIGCVHCVASHLVPSVIAEAARVLKKGGIMLSRIFRPRDTAWLSAQPFRTSRFGYEPEECEMLFSAAFARVELECTGQWTFLRCTTRES